MTAFDPHALAALHGLELKARYIMEGFLLGVHESPYLGANVEFSEYREYQPGDDLRHLDWRLLARSDRMYIKTYEQDTNARAYLIVDSSASMGYRGGSAYGSKLGVAGMTAAALAWLLLRQGDAIGLLTLADDGSPNYIRPSARPGQLGVVLGRIERLTARGISGIVPLLEHAARIIPRRSLVLVFSDFLEPAPALAHSLRRLRFAGHDLLVVQALDRDELEFPFGEGAIFEDVETGQRKTVDVGAVRANYLDRLQAFLGEHREQFRTLEIPFALLRTDQPPWPPLALYLNERRRLTSGAG